MRWLALALAALLVALQYPLWLGKGGWLRAWDAQTTLEVLRAQNGELRTRNAAMRAEIADLKVGLDAVEERARSQLGMIKDREVFFQVIEPTATGRSPPSGPAVWGAAGWNPPPGPAAVADGAVANQAGPSSSSPKVRAARGNPPPAPRP